MTRYTRTDSNIFIPPLAIFGVPTNVVQLAGFYSFVPAASGGYEPYVYSITGTLPPGFSFNTTTGELSATNASTLGTYTGLVITVTDAVLTAVSLPAFQIVVQVGAALVAPDSPTTLAGAWVPGAIYVSADNGNDNNAGTWTNQADILGTYRPIKSTTRLQQLFDAAPQGTKLTVVMERCTDWYRRTVGGYVPYNTTFGGSDSVSLDLKHGADLDLIAWGDPNKRVKIGGDVEFTGWTAIGSGEGSAYAISNGEKITLPFAALLHHFPCVGDHMCTPTFWASNKPNIDVASRWAYDNRYNGCEVFELVDSGQVHNPTGGVHDLAKRVSWSDTAKELVLQAPGMSTRYIDESPEGAVLRTVFGATTSAHNVLIAGNLNVAGNLITVPYSSKPSVLDGLADGSAKAFPWAIAGWCRDIRQAGQFGYKPVLGGTRVLHMVPPVGATGVKSVVYHKKTCRIGGNNVRVSDGFWFGRCWQEALLCRAANIVLGKDVGIGATQQMWLEVDSSGQLITFDEEQGTGRAVNVFAVIEKVDQCPGGGGISVSDVQNAVIDGKGGAGVRRNDSSSWRLGGKAEGVTYKNHVTSKQTGVHGNTDTGYEECQDCERVGFAALGVGRCITHQTNHDSISASGIVSITRDSATVARVTTVANHGYTTGQWIDVDNEIVPLAYEGLHQVTVISPTVFTYGPLASDPVTDCTTLDTIHERPFGYLGKRMRYKRGYLLGSRKVGQGAQEQATDDSFIRLDSDMQGGHHDRLISWRSSQPHSVRGNDPGEPYSHEDLLITRCILQGISVLDALPKFGGQPVKVKNCFIKPQDLSITWSGTVRAQNVHDVNADWVGALSVPQWEVYSRIIDANGDWNGTSYEECIIGPDGWLDGNDWTIPAYTVSPNFPTPRPVYVDDDTFIINQHEGTTVCYCLGGEPGSTYSLPAGVVDNALFGVDRGVIYVLTGARLSNASYTIRVRKTNAFFPSAFIETDIVLNRIT